MIHFLYITVGTRTRSPVGTLSPTMSPRCFFSIGQRFPTPKSRDFRSPERAIHFPPGQRFPDPNHVTSGSGDVTFGHVTSG